MDEITKKALRKMRHVLPEEKRRRNPVHKNKKAYTRKPKNRRGEANE